MGEKSDAPTRIERPSSPGRERTTEPAPPRTGERYTSGPEIARGGMGRVLEAKDNVLGRTVAIKEALTDEPELLKRFAREVRITALLEHPSIVPVHDAGGGEGEPPFYVMRRVSGRPLEELIAEAKTLDERLALIPNILAATQAIAHAHERGVLHRDLKPTNILVEKRGETIVIDWGLAKIIDEPDDTTSTEALPADSLRTRIGEISGTPGFMAPEQARGETPSPATDVWALGACMYFLLARQPPHYRADRTGDDLVDLAARRPVLPLGEIVRGVPVEMAAIVDRALAFDAEDRYADAAALAAELQRFLAGQLVAAHDYTVTERLGRWIKRHRAAVAVGSLAIAALAIVSFMLVRRIITERDIATSERAEADRQRVVAQDRADSELIARARTTMTTNPVQTAAVLAQLPPGTKHSDEARGILHTAQMHGARMFGIRSTSAIPLAASVAPDGKRAFIFRFGGIVEVIDLPHPTQVITRALGTGIHPRWIENGKRILVTGPGATRIWDPTTNTVETPPLPEVVALDGSADDQLFAGDTAGRFGWLDVAKNTFTPLATSVMGTSDESSIVVTGNGAYAAVLDKEPSGLHQLRLFDHTHEIAALPVGNSVIVVAAKTSKFAIVNAQQEVFQVDASSPSPALVPTKPPPDVATMGLPILFYDDDRLMAATTAGVVRFGEIRAWLQLMTPDLGFRFTPVGPSQFMTVTPQQNLLILDTNRTQTIVVPTSLETTVVGGLRDSPYVVVAGTTVDLVVDLSNVVPKRFDIDKLSNLTMFDDTTAVLSQSNAYVWFNFMTGETHPFAAEDNTQCCSVALTAHPAGDAVALFGGQDGPRNQQAWVFTKPHEHVEEARRIEGTKLAVALYRGVLLVVEDRKVTLERDRKVTPIATLAEDLYAYAFDQDTFLVVLRDEVVRIKYVTGTVEHIPLTLGTGTLAPYRDRIVVARDTTVTYSDAPGVPIARLPAPAEAAFTMNHGVVFALEGQNAVFVSLDDAIPQVYPLGHVLAMNGDAVIVDLNQLTEVVELPSRTRTRLPTVSSNFTFHPRLTETSRKVVATDGYHLRVWSLPHSDAPLLDEIRETTNAVERDGVVLWPWQQ